MRFQIISNGEHETMHIAKAIAPLFSAGDLILLDGDLGTGKTHFVKGFSEGLGSHNQVTSPTFSIAHFYETAGMDLLHIDLYRIDTIGDFHDLALTDYFPQTIVMIEWGAKFSAHFDEFVQLTFGYVKNEKNKRELTFSFKGERSASLVSLMREKLPNLQPC